MLKVAKTGNEAMAEAMRQINPDVVAVYPITPATEIAQIYASFVADGLVKTEYIAVESEHSAMSATIGAAAAGVRAMTITSSQGLALMYEMLPIVSGLRLPIVMCEVNRALSAPINIHCDHSDTMAARDFGWIQIYAENAKEAYDSVIQAVRIAEHEKVKLPVMVSTDGFIISHCLEDMRMFEDKEVQAFVGESRPTHKLLDVDNPFTLGSIDLQNYYFEHRRAVAEGMEQAKNVILEIGQEFAKKFGKDPALPCLAAGGYGLFEAYKLEDAEIAIVVLGSTAGTTKVVVEEFRKKGVKAGLLKIRVFRPFPYQELVSALKNISALAVLDRCDPANTFGGPVFAEIRAALYDLTPRPLISNYIYGLGGRDIDLEQIRSVFVDLQNIIKSGRVAQPHKYLGLRE